MRLAWIPLLALAPLHAAAEPPQRPRPDLVPVSRAMSAIEAAVRRGDVAEERKRWSEAASRAPLDAPARFLAVYAQPQGDERWAAFKALVKQFPTSALGQLGMAIVYVEWNVVDQADQSVARALAIEPDSWLAVLVRARAHERKGRDAQATADWKAVLAADPESPEAHAGLARAARRAGDAAGAQSSAEAALAADSTYFPALELLATLATEQGRDADAVALWTRAVEASPNDRRGRATLAGLYTKAGNPGAARDQWKAAVDQQEDVEGLTALAEAARAAGDLETERRALERLGALDPQMTGWRRLAEIRLEAKDWENAEKAFRRALAVDPRDEGAHLGLAKVHLARGETSEAVGALRAAGPAGKADLATLGKRINLQKVTKKDVNALQRTVSGLVDRTFRVRMAEAPGLSGTLRVRVTVDAAGSATLVEVQEDSLHDGDVLASAYWNLRDATYPPGQPGRYSFTFSFKRRATP